MYRRKWKNYPHLPKDLESLVFSTYDRKIWNHWESDLETRTNNNNEVYNYINIINYIEFY